MATRGVKIDFKQLINFDHRIDILEPRKKVRKILPDTYEVEYLLSKRESCSETEYLVKWKGYSSFDVTWEPANHLPAEVINEFYHPIVLDQELQEASDIFLTAVKSRLAQRTGQHFYVELSHRIFMYIFGECKKGLFSCKSFCNFLLPADWDLFVYTKNGEGRRIDFPVSIVPMLKWSKKHFAKDEKTGEFVEGKRRPVQIWKIEMATKRM